MKNKVTVWGFSVAGVLWIIAALRDIFAPGFFLMSNHVMTTSQIVAQFAVGIIFLAIAALAARRRPVDAR